MKKGVVVISMLIGLVSQPVFSQGPESHLGSKQIVALIKGNTVEGQRTMEHLHYHGMAATAQFKTYYRPDGELIEVPSAHVGSQSGLLLPTHGNWWSKKGWLCVRYRDSVRIPSQKRCLRVVPGKKEGTYELYSKDGKLRDSWSGILEGDPEGMASK